MKPMWMPKACTRCHGDLYRSQSEEGEVMTCLQCAREYLTARPELVIPPEVYALFDQDRKAA